MLIALITATSLFALCAAVRKFLDRPGREDQTTANGRVELTSLWNHRGAFGIAIHPTVLLTISVGALTGVLSRLRTAPVGAGLVLGGGLSNLRERLTQGRVYDYIRFPKAPGRLKRYVYNLADFGIFLGTILLLFRRKPRKTKR